MINGIDFMEYFLTGGESSDENTPKKIDEGLVDVVFKTISSNLRTTVSGSSVLFRWDWMNLDTDFTLKIKRDTLEDLVKWLNEILED